MRRASIGLSLLVYVGLSVAVFVGPTARGETNKSCTGINWGCVMPDPDLPGCYLWAHWREGECEQVEVFSTKSCEVGTGSCSLNVSALCATLVEYIGGGCENGACRAIPLESYGYYRLACLDFGGGSG
jgi:hypothetical protein